MVTLASSDHTNQNIVETSDGYFIYNNLMLLGNFKIIKNIPVNDL